MSRVFGDILSVLFAKAAPKCATPVSGGAGFGGGASFYGLSPKTDYVRNAKGKWTLSGRVVKGDPLKRLEKMRIPPAWTSAHVARSAGSKIQAVGIDAKGRPQYRYSAAHIAEQAKRKFARVRDFSKRMPSIRDRVAKDMAAGRQEAWVLRLEDKTAIRVGSAKDFKADVKAYGLTTLEGRHVAVKGSTITMDFTAKEGIRCVKTIQDKELAGWLNKRIVAAGPTGKLFPDVPAVKLNDYLKSVGGGKYTVKDFRTYHGSQIAYNVVKSYAGTALSAKQKAEVVKNAAVEASRFLGNTPAMAKTSYIDPTIWEMLR